jgi:hypothetical protein
VKRFYLCALLLILGSGAALAALPAPRPYSGCGVLVLKGAGGWQPETLVLYREPGVDRIGETPADSLPRIAGDAAEPLLPVHERRLGWNSIVLDDAGRQGWLQQARGWEYADWREFLPGRGVRLLAGLKKEWYQLRTAPDGGGGPVATLARGDEARVLQVEGDWVRIEAPAGWLRWRDPDGRLTVSIQARREEKTLTSQPLRGI